MDKKKSIIICPECGSRRIYHEVSIVAKRSPNTGRIYDINKDYIDSMFQPYYCEKCGWTDAEKYWKERS